MEYVEDKVKNFVDMDVQKPPCLASNNCEEDVLKNYMEERNEKEAEVKKLFKSVNHLSFNL